MKKNRISNFSIILIIIFGGIVVADSDLQFYAKIKVFCAIAIFAVAMFTKTVRKYLDPSFEEDDNKASTGNRRKPDNNRPSQSSNRSSALRAQHNPFFLEIKR